MCLSHVEYQHFLRKGLFAAFSFQDDGIQAPELDAGYIFAAHNTVQFLLGFTEDVRIIVSAFYKRKLCYVQR